MRLLSEEGLPDPSRRAVLGCQLAGQGNLVGSMSSWFRDLESHSHKAGPWIPYTFEFLSLVKNDVRNFLLVHDPGDFLFGYME